MYGGINWACDMIDWPFGHAEWENVVVDGSTASEWKGCLMGGLVSIISFRNKKGNPGFTKDECVNAGRPLWARASRVQVGMLHKYNITMPEKCP